MTGILIFASLTQWTWYVHKIYTGTKLYDTWLSLDSEDHPVVLVSDEWITGSQSWLSLWWNGSDWSLDTLPICTKTTGMSLAAWLMGPDDSLWFVSGEVDSTFPGGPPYPWRIAFLHGAGDTWDSLPAIVDTASAGTDWFLDVSIVPFMDTSGLPGLLIHNQYPDYSDSLLRLYRFVSPGQWEMELVENRSSHGTIRAARIDSKGFLHLFGINPGRFYHLSNETGSWVCETPDTARLSTLWTFAVQNTIDQHNQLHILYDAMAWTDSTGEFDRYQIRYLFRDSLSQWQVVDTNTHSYWNTGPAVDYNDIIHLPVSPSGAVYHWYKPAGQPGPWDYEKVDTAQAQFAFRLFLSCDHQNYLHMAYYWMNHPDVFYATTNPDIGVWEAPPSEPRQSLILSMAPSGFWVAGYSGPVSIYDATGRLILSRDIKGKTLVSPLRPGVYFVKAGRQRGRIAVLR